MTGVPHRECEKLRERLPEYADGSLAGPARARVERHLGRCPRCAAEVDDLRTVLRAVHSVAPEEVPEDLLRRVRQAVRERAPAPAGLPRLWPRIAVPVAAAVAVIAVTFALRSPPERSLRIAAEPQGAVAGAEYGSARGGRAGGGAARGLGGRGGGARGGGARGGGARPAARGPLVIAEAAEEARAGDARHLGGSDIGHPDTPATRDHAASALREPTEGDELLYSDALDMDAAKPQEAPGPAAPPGPAAMSEEMAPSAAEGKGAAGEAGDRGVYREREAPNGAAGRADGSPLGGPRAEKRSAPPGSPSMGGTAGVRRGRGPQERRLGAHRGAGAADLGQTDEVSAPSVSAALGLVQHEGRPALTLQFAADKPAAEMSVYLGDEADRHLVWQGPSPPTAPLLLTAEHIGPAAAATPVTIEAGEERRDYVLFTPILARLGEVAASAPTGAYAGESVAQALAEFTALTGLVVLAEEPLSQVLAGDKPSGQPDAALQEIAAGAGLVVERAGDLVFNLKHPR